MRCLKNERLSQNGKGNSKVSQLPISVSVQPFGFSQNQCQMTTASNKTQQPMQCTHKSVYIYIQSQSMWMYMLCMFLVSKLSADCLVSVHSIFRQSGQMQKTNWFQSMKSWLINWALHQRLCKSLLNLGRAVRIMDHSLDK